MKIILGISLILNLILGYFLVMRRPEREIVERQSPILEALPPHPKSTTHVNFEPDQKSAEKKVRQQKKDDEDLGIVSLQNGELQDAGEKMEADRTEFLTVKLGLTDEKITQINNAREDYFKESALFWKKNPMRELSFDDRRKMMALEEDLYKKLEKIYGKKNWAQYQKFRERYNEKGYQKQLEDGQPFIFMGL